MGIKERRQEEKEAVRKKIIDAASEIIAKEGYESLSIRKIANKIEYSPGVIYHYFKDKAEIITSSAEEGYGRILKRISSTPVDMENPDKTIINILKSYIDLMLESPQQFRAIMMSDIEAIQEKVNMLDEGISKKRKSIEGLCSLLTLGMRSGKFRPRDVELTAQIIWTSTYGLVSRLILEKGIPSRQREKLIDHHLEVLMNGLLE